MPWKWSEAKGSGSMERERFNHLSGGAKFNIAIILCVLALVGWGVAVFTAPYLRKARFENRMADWMREYRKIGYDAMIEELIKEAKKAGLPPLTEENFEFEGDVGQESVLRCHYQEAIKLPRGRYYVINMVLEKQIKIPYE